MTRRPAQIPALDGIRGLAALMVIVFHAWQAGAFDRLGLGSLARVAKFGQTGVDLFFVLSGFLITRILLASRSSPQYFRAFYLRRALRILPLYYFFLVLFLFIVPVLEHRPPAPFRQTWWWWVYLQNIPSTLEKTMPVLGPGHYWSLAVEEHFYLVWPFLVLLIPLRGLVQVCLLLMGSAVAVRWVFVCLLGVSGFYFTLCRMDALAWGALLACLEADGGLLRLRRRFTLILLILVPGLVFLWTRVADQGVQWLQVIKYTLVGGAYWALLGLAVSRQDQLWLQRALGNRALRFCGKISYGLYVYQGLTLLLVDRWLPARSSGIAFFAAVLLSTLLISWLSFTILESPFLKLKRLFDYRACGLPLDSKPRAEPQHTPWSLNKAP